MMTEQTEQDFRALWEAVATGRLEVVAEALSSGHALTGSGTNSCSGDSAASSSFVCAATRGRSDNVDPDVDQDSANYYGQETKDAHYHVVH